MSISRRRFMSSTAAGIAGAALPRKAAGQTGARAVPPSDRVVVGLIGAGSACRTCGTSNAARRADRRRVRRVGTQPRPGRAHCRRGTQQRSGRHFQAAVGLVRNAAAGGGAQPEARCTAQP